jgi:hypothetical protein
MHVFIEPAPWPDRPRDPHLLFAAGLLLFTGYLLFVLVLAIVGPVATIAPTAGQERRVALRIEARPEPEPETPGRASDAAQTERPSTSDVVEAATVPASAEAPVARPGSSTHRTASVRPAPATKNTAIRGRLDLTIPTPEPAGTLPPICRAGPCAPGTEPPPRVRANRRPADEVLADLDPGVLENLDLEALGIDPELADVFGQRSVQITRNCDLVQRADNVVTRQMTAIQFIRCRQSTASKARAQALLDALREKRPDLFEDR